MKSSPLPKVSILLPTRNQATLLERALTCLAKQNYPAFELLVCDDASTDETSAVLASFRSLFTKGYFSKNEKHQGVVKTLQNLLRKARGEFILSTASDDFIHDPNFLTDGFRMMAQFPETAGFFCNCRLLDLFTGKENGQWIYPESRGKVLPKTLLYYLLNDQSFIPGAACVLRRETWDNAFSLLANLGPQLDYYIVYSSGAKNGLCTTGAVSVSISIARDKSSFGSNVTMRKSIFYHACFEANLQKIAAKQNLGPLNWKSWRCRKFSQITEFDHNFRHFRTRLFSKPKQAVSWKSSIEELALHYRNSYYFSDPTAQKTFIQISFLSLVVSFYRRSFYRKLRSLSKLLKVFKFWRNSFSI